MSDFYMHSHGRFTSNFNEHGSRFNQSASFEMATSAQHRQFHELKIQMTSDVLQLFKANEIGFLKAPVKPKCRPLDPISTTGINIMDLFSIPNTDLIDEEKLETKQQKKKRIMEEKRVRNQKKIQEKIKQWNCFNDQRITSDPQKTLLVARLNLKTTEKNLKFQFEKYGIIKSVCIVRDLNNKSRGYGFVEFDNKSDFINAYKQANHRKIDGYKILVDYEKGRNLLRWRPRRFGGGCGQCRLTKQQLQKMQRQIREREVAHRNRMNNHEKSRSRSHRKDRKKDKKVDKDHKEKKKKEKKDRRDRQYPEKISQEFIR